MHCLAVADPGFTRWRGANPNKGQPNIWPIFPQNDEILVEVGHAPVPP